MQIDLNKTHYLKHFYICIDSSSATNSDSDTDSENIFYSTYHESKRVQPKPPLASVTQSSACSFRLNISQGLLTAYSPVRVSISQFLFDFKTESFYQKKKSNLFKKKKKNILWIGFGKPCDTGATRWICHKAAKWISVFGERFSWKWQFELHVRASVSRWNVSYWPSSCAIDKSTASPVWMCIAQPRSKYNLSNTAEFNCQSSGWQKSNQSRNDFNCRSG